MRNEIKTIIDKLVENAIRQNGVENKKTIQIVTNAENLKEKYEQNLVKLY